MFFNTIIKLHPKFLKQEAIFKGIHTQKKEFVDLICFPKSKALILHKLKEKLYEKQMD